MESGWASCILPKTDISKSWAVLSLPPDDHSLEMLDSTVPPSFYRLWTGKERGRRGPVTSSSYSFFQFSTMLVWIEPPFIYKHGGNVSHVCETCETRAPVVLKPTLAIFSKRGRKGYINICLQAGFKIGNHVLKWLTMTGLFNSDF